MARFSKLLNSTEHKQEPGYFNLVREYAAKEGITEAEFLARDRADAKNPDYPTDKCLVPDEALEVVAAFDARFDRDRQLFSLVARQGEKLPDEVLQYREHVESCPFCGVLVASMQPPPDKREKFIDAVRTSARNASANHEAALGADRNHYQPRTKQLGIVSLCVIVTLAMPYVLTTLFSKTFTAALGEVSRQFSLGTILFVVIVLVSAPKILKKLGQVLGSSFVRTGNAIVSYRWVEAGAFACLCVVLFYGSQALSLRKEVLVSQAQFRTLAASYLEHNYLSTPQPPALQAAGFQLVDQTTTGDSKVYVAKRQDVPGTFEAKVEGSEADVSWTVNKKLIPQFKLQVGQVKSLADNKLGIAFGSGDFVHVSANLSQQPLTDGRLVVAQIVKSGDEKQALVVKRLDTKPAGSSDAAQVGSR